MRAALIASISGLCLSACATLPATPATAYLPPGVYGVYLDNDTGAINQSAWAFASSANTRDNPVDAIKAVIALEYLSGELRANPRWVGMDLSVKQRMAQARQEVRQILGIRPDAPPQLVVNALLGAAESLEFGVPDGRAPCAKRAGVRQPAGANPAAPVKHAVCANRQPGDLKSRGRVVATRRRSQVVSLVPPVSARGGRLLGPPCFKTA